MENLLYLNIFYISIIVHILILFYYFLVMVASITGKLAKYPRLNKGNFYFITAIIALQLWYNFRCPLTVWQNYAANKLGYLQTPSFVVQLFSLWDIELAPKIVLWSFISFNCLIVASYFFYTPYQRIGITK